MDAILVAPPAWPTLVGYAVLAGVAALCGAGVVTGFARFAVLVEDGERSGALESNTVLGLSAECWDEVEQ